MIIKCLETWRRVKRVVRHTRRAILHKPGIVVAVVWVSCATAGIGGYAWATHQPPALDWDQDHYSPPPVQVPEPAMLLTWLAAVVFIAARKPR